MDYQIAIAYLYSFTDFERDPGQGQLSGIFGLERIAELLDDLGHPERCAPVIHLAGTKGKGSTAAFIESVLRRAGYRTGLFTSPHLHDFAERIRIDGAPISPAVVTGAIEALFPAIEPRRRPPSTGGLTAFEVTTALAFDCFRAAGVDVQIIETGLGGRLDSTNVVDSTVAAITSIGYDHTAVLGETLTAIAGEKAGIIKPGARVVIGPQPEEALRVLEERCAALGVRPALYGREFGANAAPPAITGQPAVIWQRPPGIPPLDVRLPLLGEHQAENAAVAVAVLEAFRAARSGDGLAERIGPEAIAEGLRSTEWPGRFDIVRRQPWVIADGAHTEESADRLRRTLEQVFPGRRVTFVIGTSRDKPVEAIAAALAAVAGPFIAVAADHPRALPVEVLAERLRSAGYPATRAETTRSALNAWLPAAGPGDILVATGSLFVAAETIRWAAPAGTEKRLALAGS